MDPFSILFFTFMSQLKSFLTSGPSWLTDDVHDDSISDYFPPGVTKVLSQKSVPMKLSVLLEAFQQLITKSFDEGNEDSDDQLKNLQRLYEQSEERCKQLVVVTQQWALECGDKDKVLLQLIMKELSTYIYIAQSFCVCTCRHLLYMSQRLNS